MYARSYGNDDKPGGFFKGEYNVPANYSGNVFVADTHASPPSAINELPEDELPSGIKLQKSENEDKSADTGLLRSIISRFERSFKLDDLILIGLLILFIQNDKKDCDKSSDEMILMLAFLFLCGF